MLTRIAKEATRNRFRLPTVETPDGNETVFAVDFTQAVQEQRSTLRPDAPYHASTGPHMRSLLVLATLAVAPSPGETELWYDRGGDCGEYRMQADHYATALDRISECLAERVPAEGVDCVKKVLAEAEI